MKTISSLLSRFKDFTPPSLAVVRAVRGILKEKFSIDVPERSIRYSHGTAHIAQGGVQKTEILLHKQEIISAVRAVVGDGFRDIQ